MILASLKPYYYYLIAEKKKTIEVRKSRLKNLPQDIAFYMSKDEKSFAKIPKEFQEKYRKHFGKVGMQFVCDRITDISVPVRNCNEDYNHVYHNDECKGSCLTWKELQEYGKGKPLYAWHISDLKIYDKPKELGEFFVKGECPEENCGFCKNFHRGRGWLNGDTYDENDCIVYGIKPITRPPQSWFYIEEL